jgi:hypothetical protein
LDYLERAYDLNGRNRNKQALPLARQATNYLRHKSEAFNLLGLIYHRLQKQEEAKHAFSQALALSANYEPARQNMERLTKVQPPEFRRSALGNLRDVFAKPTPDAGQKKNQQNQFVIVAIISLLCSWIFPNLYAVLWPLITGFGVIVIVYAAVSFLLGGRLSESARPGQIVIGLLAVQLFRLVLSLWLEGSIFLPTINHMGVLMSIAAILWLIFLPGISAYLASIVTTLFIFLYEMAFLAILLSTLPAASFNWILDLALTVGILYFSWGGYKEYELKIIRRQQLEAPDMEG